MKAIFVILLIFISICVASFFVYRNTNFDDQGIVTPFGKKNQVSGKPISEREFLFVPYWSLSGLTIIDEKAEAYIYFGLSGTASGIDRQDAGFRNLRRFVNVTPLKKKTFLGIRMLDSEENSNILKDVGAQKKTYRASELNRKRIPF